MEAASGLVKTSIDLFNLLDASYQKKFNQLPEEIKSIQRELHSIEEVIINSSVSSSWISHLKEIRQRIEDSVDFYNYKVICEDDDPGSLYSAYHAIKTLLGPSSKLSKDIEDIKKLIADANGRKIYHQQANQATTNNGAYKHPDEANPQGLETPKEELLQLLGTSLQRSTKLKVIAISGLGGSGKTILAKAAFNQVYEEFDCYSCVTASKDVNKLLKDIFDNVRMVPKKEEKKDNVRMVTPQPSEGRISNHLATGPPSEDDISDNVRMVTPQPSEGRSSNHLATGPPSEDDISDRLRKLLDIKRYIIRIDDLQMETGLWNNVLCAFPDDGNSSRIIVTTSNDKLARRCSQNCRVLRMQPLDIGFARALLERELRVGHSCPTNSEQSLEMIVKSCECHPLAVVNMAGHIRDHKRWEWDHDKCEQACNLIGFELVNGTGAFVRMSRVLNHTYSSLSYNTMTCLLSLSTYPKNHAIRRKSLIRRWLAERLITCKDQRSDDDILEDCIMDLVDHNLIIPIKISISGEVKAFRVHQMVLQFIKVKANSDNFVTWVDIHDGKRMKQANNITRLYLDNSSPKPPRIGKKVDLSRVRSLTFSGQASKNLMNFKDFKLLRVLDLESCKTLENSNLDTVCKSSMLKYLSIRGNQCVSELPPSIMKLRYLETLDIRDTKVEVLTMEVIKLPQLAHLFGEFRIACKNSELSNMETFLKKKNSNLHTLAGFCIGESPGVVKLLPLMLKLMKVKILCRRTAPRIEVLNDLLLSLKGCFQRKLSPPNLSLGSLSIDFGDVCDLDFLHKIEAPPSFLRSLKLHGNLQSKGLPKFILSNSLKELCLSGTNLGCSVLSKIQGLQNLEFLKLTEDRFRTEAEEIICERGWFVNLKRLCIDIPILPKIVIQDKSMGGLKSLQLLCLVLGGISGIAHLLHLEELILPSNVSGAEVDDLSLQLIRHQMRPKFDRPSADAGRSKRSEPILARSRRIAVPQVRED